MIIVDILVLLVLLVSVVILVWATLTNRGGMIGLAAVVVSVINLSTEWDSVFMRVFAIVGGCLGLSLIWAWWSTKGRVKTAAWLIGRQIAHDRREQEWKARR